MTPDALMPVGTELRASHFVAGQYVDVTGVTIGKGFQGVMKKWGFHGGPASHGNSLAHRVPGSTGANQVRAGGVCEVCVGHGLKHRAAFGMVESRSSACVQYGAGQSSGSLPAQHSSPRSSSRLSCASPAQRRRCRRAGPGQGVEGQENAWPHGWRAAHGPELLCVQGEWLRVPAAARFVLALHSCARVQAAGSSACDRAGALHLLYRLASPHTHSSLTHT